MRFAARLDVRADAAEPKQLAVRLQERRDQLIWQIDALDIPGVVF